MGKQQLREWKGAFLKKTGAPFTSIFSFLRSHGDALALMVFLLAFHGITNHAVMQEDTVFFDGVPAFHYLDAVKLSSGGLRALLSTPWRFLTWYPPATQYPIVSSGGSALFLSAFGITQDNAVMSNLIWLAILLPSLYALAFRLFNKRCALLSILLVSFFPGIVAASRGFVKDLPLASMVSLSLATLIYSEGMKRRLPSVLFGLSIALAALTHSMFILFLLGPFLLAVALPMIESYRHHGLAAIKRRLGNGIIVAGIVLILAGPGYLAYAPQFAKEVRLSAEGRAGIYPAWLPPSLLLSALRHHLTLGPLLLAICAFVGLGDAKRKYFLLAWIIPAAIFGASVIPQTRWIPRYILPAIPAFAIILGRLLEVLLGFERRNARKNRRIFFAGCSLLLCFGMLFTLYATFWEYRYLLGPLGGGRTYTPADLNSGYRISPVRMKADIESAAALLMDELEARSTPAEVFLMDPQGTFTFMIVTEPEARQIITGKRLFSRTQCIKNDDHSFRWVGAGECIEFIESADYLIIENMNGLPLETARNETFPAIIDYIQENSGRFQTLAELPNDDIAFRIYDSYWPDSNGSQKPVGLPKQEVADFSHDIFKSNDLYTTPDFVKGGVLILKALH